jgi:hypothetical protein
VRKGRSGRERKATRKDRVGEGKPTEMVEKQGCCGRSVEENEEGRKASGISAEAWPF